jgi:hypothetical protein
MKSKIINITKTQLLAAPRLGLVAALLALAAQTTVVRAGGGDDGNPSVLPPNSHPYGKSYIEWSEAHWQWLYSIPADNHPVFQDGNVDLSLYQPPGHVWFLCGSFSATPVSSGLFATANRTGTVPHGKALFFPIIDAEASTAEGNGTTKAQLLAAARGFLDPASGLACEIDGQPVQHLERYRFETPVFVWGPVPANNLLSLPVGTTTRSVSAGYFLMLAPLPPGQHTIHFTGTSGVSPNAFSLDITYHLTVQGRPPGQNGDSDDDDDQD